MPNAECRMPNAEFILLHSSFIILMKISPPKSPYERQKIEAELTRMAQQVAGPKRRAVVYLSRYGWIARTVLVRDQQQRTRS